MAKEMLDHGIIEHSSSPWASPIVLVSKHDGSTCFCVRLNAITKLDEFSLPRIDDSLDLLSGMKNFSTLTGYWQVSMSPDSKEKTAFRTHEGLYEFSDALWPTQCAGHLPTPDGSDFAWSGKRNV